MARDDFKNLGFKDDKGEGRPKGNEKGDLRW